MKDPDQDSLWEQAEGDEFAGPPERRETVGQRIVRNGAVAQSVKARHSDLCQICGIEVRTLAGRYSEAAHIKPLGSPHDGPDVRKNILCLCPNCHVRLDNGGIVVNEAWKIIDTRTFEVLGELRTIPLHPVDPEMITHHRERWLLARGTGTRT